MGVSVLSNCGDYNHYNYLMKYSKMADKIIIVSPFLTMDMPRILSEMQTIKHVELYTNLDGYGTASVILPAVRRLYEYCYDNGIYVSVKCNDRLHGKVYLLYKEDKGLGCIITSGNFTDNGLKNNHEYGVFLDNESMQKELVNQIYSLGCLELTYKEVIKLNGKLEEFIQNHSAHNIPVFKASDYIQNKIVMPDSCRFFLKSLGNEERPIVRGNTIIKEIEDDGIGFKKESACISKDDIIICYICKGEHVGNVLGYWKVLDGEPKEKIAFEGDQWKWKFTTGCMSEKYSSRWWDFDIKIRNLLDEYKEIKGQDDHVTPRGNDTLRGMRKGYMKITKEFAQFVMESLSKL